MQDVTRLDHITLVDAHPPLGDLRAEVVAGLSRPQKSLPCKYFYDAEGSVLFDRITETEDYYLTRKDVAILGRYGAEMGARIGPNAVLMELGSGSSTKTPLLLRELNSPRAYVAVDISRDHLVSSSTALAQDFPELEVFAICADYTEPFDLPAELADAAVVAAYFPGSTIGNFTQDEAVHFLGRLARGLGKGSDLIISADLVKDTRRLERAYDDSEGITAAFNLNVLTRLNRELGMNFDVAQFVHRAVWNPTVSRIEMHLESPVAQTIRVDGWSFELAAGEHIHTESCHKYTLDSFGDLAARAGYRVDTVWLDDDAWFSTQLLVSEVG